MKVTVSLNGTSVNPHLKYGLNMNPFPAIARAEYHAANMALARLGSEPLRGPDHIREILSPVVGGPAGEELIQLCIRQFKPGEIVRFTITFPE